MSRLIAITSLVLLSGCAGVSSHVSGTFACGAPQGTCAPTISIDDRALANIAGHGNNDAPKGAGSGAGSFGAIATATYDSSKYPARQARIVFPAYIDEKGRRHDPAGIYVTLNDARFADAASSGGTSATTPASVQNSAIGFVPSKTNLVAAASAQDDAVDPVPPAVPLKLGEARPVIMAMRRHRGLRRDQTRRRAAAVSGIPAPDPTNPSAASSQSFPASSVQH